MNFYKVESLEDMKIRQRDERRKKKGKMMNIEVYYFDCGVLRKFTMIEKAKLSDGRTINYALISSKVEIEKDAVLKEFFDNWDKKVKK